MKIVVTEAAARWFKNDFNIDKNEKVKFYARIYGSSPVQENFALGFDKETDPNNEAVHTEVNGVSFYIEDEDVWFFDGHDLHVHYDKEEDELIFDYKK